MASDVKWIKIVTDIFDDEKILLIESLPDADSIIVIWFKLLCLAGKQNNSGVFTMGGIPYTEQMFATIFRRKEAIISLALKTFQQFGMIEIVENAVTIPKWGKYQSLDKIEQKTAYMRGYMQEYRVKQKQIASGKVNSKTNGKANVSSADKNKIRLDIPLISPTGGRCEQVEYSPEFISFWESYPKKVGKGAACKAFKKLKCSDKLDSILSALEWQKSSEQWKKDAGQFIPNPATYLNQSRWEDEKTAELNDGETPPYYQVV